MSSQLPNQPSGEAVPLPDRNNQPSYTPRPEVEALTPKTPEMLPPRPSSGPQVTSTVISVIAASPGNPKAGGGVQFGPDTLDSAPLPRQSARDVFKTDPEIVADGNIVHQLITSQRLRDLWNQMDALQEEVIQNVTADRSTTDNYQQDLLYASSLLLQSADKYDEAREVVYRVRADLTRERKVAEDIKRWRPALLTYYALWFLIVVIVSHFDPQFRALVPDSVPILKLAYPPILFAILGSLFNGIMALNQHTTLQKDFDSAFVTWYLINPVVGGLLGLIVFVFFVVTGTSFTPTLISDPNIASTQSPLVIWLLAFIVGWQQNTAVQLLNGFLKTFSTSSSSRDVSTPPPTTSSR